MRRRPAHNHHAIMITSRRRRPPCFATVLMVAALFGLYTADTLGQTATMPKGAAPNAAGQVHALPAAKAANGADPTAHEARDEIRKKLEAALAQLAAIESSPGHALGAPADTPQPELVTRLALLRQVTGLYQQQLDLLARIEAGRTERVEAERLLESWGGFATPPPHSLLVVDGLRDAEESADARMTSAQSRQALFERFGTELEARLKASETAARLADEAADRAHGTPGSARAVWLRDLARLQAQVDGATRELMQMGVRNAREEAATAELSRTLARRKRADAGHDFTLPPVDLQRIQAEIDTRRRTAERNLERALRAAATAADAQSEAERRLSVAPAPERAALEEDLHVKREVASAAALRTDLLKQYLQVLEGERITWEVRAGALALRDPIRSRAAYEELSSKLATVRTWHEFLKLQHAAVHARVEETETKLRTATAAEAAMTQLLLDTYRQREQDLERAQASTGSLERILRNFRDDFAERRQVSLAERARDAGAAVLLAFRRAWNFEIFTVEDSYETPDGRRLGVERSVTIGKTVGALLIVVVGYWLCNWIARRIERLAVKRGHIAPQSAALLRNWILFVLTAILVIVALVSSSIPLTVFAFLGGALAIAAGFGMQTLLKNFTAGIMLLVERPMRLGDLVEVDGIRGRVTAIGIRASTILGADGIETMIPNGAFIENKLTNWTYSNPQARQLLSVGVAYGTPLRKANEILQDVLARHGLVLKDPAPQVYLDDYGDSAIGFVLTWWVEMTPTNDIRRIKSDLLHMIDRAFADAGIAIPFPQRDVHLDAGAPIKVEVVAPS